MRSLHAGQSRQFPNVIYEAGFDFNLLPPERIPFYQSIVNRANLAKSLFCSRKDLPIFASWKLHKADYDSVADKTIVIPLADLTAESDSLMLSFIRHLVVPAHSPLGERL